MASVGGVGFGFRIPRVRSAKNFFFDRAKVINRLDRAEKRWMSRAGAFIRSDARRSMRRARLGRSNRTRDQRGRFVSGGPKRLLPSPPGTPPRAREGLLKRFLYFVYEPRFHSVVVGPALLSGRPRRPTVPEVHEYGGSIRGRDGRLRRYPKRPYMGPAYDKNKNKIEEWRDTVRE